MLIFSGALETKWNLLFEDGIGAPEMREDNRQRQLQEFKMCIRALWAIFVSHPKFCDALMLNQIT